MRLAVTRPRSISYAAAAAAVALGTVAVPADAAPRSAPTASSRAISGTPTTAAAATVTGDPGAYVPVTPYRVLDTRIGLHALGPITHGSTFTVRIPGTGTVPDTGVDAVVLTVTVTAARRNGYLTVYPAGSSRPHTSTVNFRARRTTPNPTLVKLGAGGKVAFTNGSSGSIQVVADVAGYILSGTSTHPGALVSMPPARVLDSRTSPTFGGALQPQESRSAPVAGLGGIPATGAQAAVVNLTETGATKGGYLTAYPSGADRPTASTLNFRPGASVANLAVVPLGADGAILLYSSSPEPVHAVIDVLGYVTDGAAVDAGMLAPIGPIRVLDTRMGLGGAHTVPARGTIRLTVAGVAGVPGSRVAAVVLNLTETKAAAGGYLTAYPTGTTRPTASNSNFVRGQTSAHTVVVRVGPSGEISIYNGSPGSIELVADLQGYLVDAPPPAPGARPIAAGFNSTCTVTPAGGVKCWGAGLAGNLGDGSTVERDTPVDVVGLGGIVAVSISGGHSCALSADGDAWCWGSNTYGELGDGSTTRSSTPVATRLPGPASEIVAGGGYTCAVVNRALYCWGRGSKGLLGLGSQANAQNPTLVPDFAFGVETVAASNTHTCAVKDGDLFCWGENGSGQLGNPDVMSLSTTPVPVNLPAHVHDLDLKNFASLAVDDTGRVWAWGEAYVNGTFFSPADEPLLDTSTVGGDRIALSATGSACMLTTAGAIQCWGGSYYGELGDGLPGHVAAAPQPVPGLESGATSIAFGQYHACATVNGSVRCWGMNDEGQIGSSSVPVGQISRSPVTPDGF